jgi:hypothetical protein
VKKVFTALALVAMVNLSALSALAGYAGARNWITRDRVRRAIAVLKGEESGSAAEARPPAVAPQHTTAASSEAHEPTGSARGSIETIRHSQELDEITRTELDRRAREIHDGWRMLETRQLALVRDREAFEHDKARLAEAQRAREETTGGGDKKELEIVSGLKPKQAKALLKAKPEADAVALLKAMEPRKVQKIVGECKSEEDRLWIGRVLDQLDDRAMAQAEVPSAGT